jgi:hypothetical protein
MIRYEVWDPAGVLETRSFDSEKEAYHYRSKLEKEHGRLFRMSKLFEEEPSKNLVPQEYVSVVLTALPGDHITSKKGVLMHSSMTDKTYLVRKLEVCENGRFCAIEKTEVVK